MADEEEVVGEGGVTLRFLEAGGGEEEESLSVSEEDETGAISATLLFPSFSPIMNARTLRPRLLLPLPRLLWFLKRLYTHVVMWLWSFGNYFVEMFLDRRGWECRN